MAHRIYIPELDGAVIPDLNAFLVVLTYLPIEAQIDILDQATKQISAVVSNPKQSR